MGIQIQLNLYKILAPAEGLLLHEMHRLTSILNPLGYVHDIAEGSSPHISASQFCIL